ITMERRDIPGLALSLGGFARNDHDIVAGLQKAIKAGTVFLYAPGEKPSRLAKDSAKADSPVVQKILNGEIAIHPRVNWPDFGTPKAAANAAREAFQQSLERRDVTIFNLEDPETPFAWSKLEELERAVDAEKVVLVPVPSFISIGDIEQALAAKTVSLHTRIRARYATVDENNRPIVKRVETTP